MHLVETLATGVRGAENGYAELYRRGTSTRATWYSGFDASGANSSGQNIVLDSFGGAVVYVDEHVDVIVKSSDGTTIRSFVSSAAAPAIEVISQSFTGVDYDDGESGASKPVALDTVLDRWKTSAGTIDWNVLLGGVARTLQSALSPLGKIFVVTDVQYGGGASGNGTTDDTAAIQACLTAAGATGGTVLFPPGSYKVTAGLTVPGAVDLVGMTATILFYHATDHVLSYATLATLPQLITGLSVYPMAAHSGNLVNQTGMRLRVVGGKWGSDTLSNATLFALSNSVNCELMLEQCRIYMASTTAAFITSANAGARVKMSDNYLTAPAAYAGAVAVDAAWLEVRNDYWTTASTTAHTWLSRGASSILKLLDTDIIASTNATILSVTNGAASVFEDGCRFSGTTPISCAVDISSGNFYSSVRNRREAQYVTSTAGGTITMNATEYGSLVLNIDNNTATTININRRMPNGSEFFLTLANDSGGVSGNITIDSDIQQGSNFRSAFTVAAGDWKTIKLRMVYGNGGGTPTWMQVGDQTAVGVNPA